MDFQIKYEYSRYSRKQLTNTLSIYPNPANDIIHVNTSTSLTNESYSIVNTLGQTILNGKLEMNIQPLMFKH
jgi:capsular polysaccharide biosynthesis protein